MGEWTAAMYAYAARTAGDEAIAAMSPEQLRELARTAIHGTLWPGTARELCDFAVREPDPSAALVRVAAASELDPATAEPARSYCSIYVEGRRFKHRTLPPP